MAWSKSNILLLTFINDEILPRNAPQHSLLLQYRLIRTNEGIELVLAWVGRIGLEEFRPGVLAFVVRPAHAHGPDRGTPAIEFLHPIPHHSLGYDDQVRPLDAAYLAQICE